ncbi:hypothetical protein ACKUSY_07930 [Myroides odoratus]
MAEQYKIILTYYVYKHEENRIHEKFEIKQSQEKEVFDSTAYILKEFSCLSSYFNLKEPGFNYYESIGRLTEEWNNKRSYNPQLFTVFDNNEKARSLSFLKALDFYNHSEQLVIEVDRFKKELERIYFSEFIEENESIIACLERQDYDDIDEIWRINLDDYKEIESILPDK